MGIPIYYACKPFIMDSGSVSESLSEYRAIFTSFYFKPAMVWLPAHLFTFTVVPPPLRIAWIASVSLGWLTFVSMTANS